MRPAGGSRAPQQRHGRAGAGQEGLPHTGGGAALGWGSWAGGPRGSPGVAPQPPGPAPSGQAAVPAPCLSTPGASTASTGDEIFNICSSVSVWIAPGEGWEHPALPSPHWVLQEPGCGPSPTAPGARAPVRG